MAIIGGIDMTYMKGTSLMHNAWNSMAFVIVRDMAGEESICRKPMPLHGAARLAILADCIACNLGKHEFQKLKSQPESGSGCGIPSLTDS